jgi:hypothetical protein
MDDILGALAFALLIGGQFLAVIVVTSTRTILYENPNERAPRPVRPMDYPSATTLQHCASPDVALAHLALAQHASGRAPRALGRASASEELESRA